MAGSGRREAIARALDGLAVVSQVVGVALEGAGHAASAAAAEAVATLAREAAAAVRGAR